jgi:hypothetical protein
MAAQSYGDARGRQVFLFLWALCSCAVRSAALSTAGSVLKGSSSPVQISSPGEDHIDEDTELTRWSQSIHVVADTLEHGSDQEEASEIVEKETVSSRSSFPAGPWEKDIQATEQFPAALKAVKDRLGTPTKAAILYLQMGPWPPYIKYVVKSAAANNGTTFYFLGPHFEEVDDCANCAWLPFDINLAKTRIQANLGVSVSDMDHLYPAKLCDLKPAWPTLFPELATRHEWIGFADHDIIFGDLDSEVNAVSQDADLLVPKGFYPQPLANGNLMLFRTTKKMLQAFKNAGNWEDVVRDHNYLGFDEWWGVKPSMMEILVDMHLKGKITVAPTLRPLIQDFTVTHPGGMYGAGMDQNASVQLYWAHGRLAAKRHGMCICPDPNAWQFAFMPLSGCSECMRKPEGGLMPEVTVNRTVEALGFHFQAWKKKKSWKSCSGVQYNCDGWMPSCKEKPGFHFGVRGFSCWGTPPPATPRVQEKTNPFYEELQKLRLQLSKAREAEEKLRTRFDKLQDSKDALKDEREELLVKSREEHSKNLEMTERLKELTERQQRQTQHLDERLIQDRQVAPVAMSSGQHRELATSDKKSSSWLKGLFR